MLANRLDIDKQALWIGTMALILTVMSSTADATTYKARWDQVGGSWSTGWVTQSTSNPTYGNNANKCGHFHHGANCGSGYAGWYRSGSVTHWWPRGCSGPHWKIRCTVRR